jgi:hypothetical protein
MISVGRGGMIRSIDEAHDNSVVREIARLPFVLSLE